MFQRQCQENKIAGPLPGAWTAMEIVQPCRHQPRAVFLFTHSGPILFFSPSAFRKFENAFSMRENAVSDEYG